MFQGIICNSFGQDGSPDCARKAEPDEEEEEAEEENAKIVFFRELGDLPRKLLKGGVRPLLDSISHQMQSSDGERCSVQSDHSLEILENLAILGGVERESTTRASKSHPRFRFSRH